MRYRQRIISIFVALVLFLSNTSYVIECIAQEAQLQTTESKTNVEASGSVNNLPDYDTYIKALNPDQLSYGTIEADSKNIVEVSEKVIQNAEFAGKSSVCKFEQSGSYAEWVITVEKEGYYRIGIEYCGTQGKQTDIEIALYINGKLPFDDANCFLLHRQYRDTEKITQDKLGNDILPMKQEVYGWQFASLKDREGIHNDPLYFHFKTGENRIRLEMVQANVAISKIKLYNTKPSDNYKQYSNQNRQDSSKKDEVSKDTSIVIQGEEPYITTHTVLHPTYDRMSSITQPNDPAKLRLNTIGQSNWKMPGQSITWEFEIKQAGYYNIGMRARQNIVRGFFSSRDIYIDGKILFGEMQNVQVNYSTGWKIKMLGDDEPYLIYFDKGRHTITMEVVAGVVGTSVKKFESVILDLNQLYREMIMVTGTTPDSYRDYKLEQEIPDLKERMVSLAKRLRAIKQEMERYNVKRGSDAVVAEQLAIQLDSFIKKPRTVPVRLSAFQDKISSLSSWVLSLKEQPLEIDYIVIQSPEAEVPTAEAGLMSQILFRFQSFISSFVEDYSMISDVDYGKDALNVWVSLGRDQAQVIKDLTESYFSPEYGTKVNVSLVQQGLVEATAAGKGPDVMLYCGISDPVNLAARNALVDLSQFEEFAGVKDWYTENAFVPYQYNGGIYALPLEQSFIMMFYRKDILADLGVVVPKTWEDFYNAAIKIQKKKLSVGIPVGSVTAPDNSMFDTLLYQNGGSYYNSNLSATNFESEAALNAFRQWTEFYTKYSFPIEFNFYVRFRSGEMPLALQNYTMYNTLSVAAPEIKGLWGMTTIPGTVDKDGTIDNTVVSGGTGCLMLAKAKNQDKCFAFMKWFASAETQTQYGLTIENILGQGGRYAPANLGAFQNMNWSSDQMSVLLNQFKNTNITPIIPATYHVTRNITNAFRAVTVKGLNARETLYSYSVDINAEISRKRLELGLD